MDEATNTLNQQRADLYLDLIKKCLSFSLWPEPPIPIETFNYTRGPVTQVAVRLASKVLATRDLGLFKQIQVSDREREQGLNWPGYGDTMIGNKRLDNLQFCVETTLRQGVEGDFIETGVWRGGACILMRAVLKAYGVKDRTVFVADSFEGLPKPDAERYPADTGDQHYTHDFLAVSQQEVEENFRKYGLLDDQVHFLKGWFSETLHTAPIEKLAVIRLDGDMYSSTIQALEVLYPKLSSGGYCIVDDYALKGCKQAVDDFRRSNGINQEVQRIDWSGIFWKKQ